MMDSYVDTIPRAPGLAGRMDRQRLAGRGVAFLTGLRWLWRRGNRARRYAKMKGTLATPRQDQPRRLDDSRAVRGHRPLRGDARRLILSRLPWLWKA